MSPYVLSCNIRLAITSLIHALLASCSFSCDLSESCHACGIMEGAWVKGSDILDCCMVLVRYATHDTTFPFKMSFLPCFDAVDIQVEG